MAIVAAKKEKDPDSPIQTLRTRKGPVRVMGKFWIVGGNLPKPDSTKSAEEQGKRDRARVIILTPEGGYRYSGGRPIRDVKDLMLMPEPDRTKALEWWENKDLWQDTAPRKIDFEQRTGYPIYADTGEYVEDMATLQAYWPDGPVLFAATCALGKRLEAKVGQSAVSQVIQGVAPVPERKAPAPAKAAVLRGKPKAKKPVPKSRVKPVVEKVAAPEAIAE